MKQIITFIFFLTFGFALIDSTIYASGGTPVITSNQSSPFTGILWVVQRDNMIEYNGGVKNLSLFAYDATALAVQLLKDPSVLSFGTCHGMAIVEPTVINGKVYVPSKGYVSVFF